MERRLNLPEGMTEARHTAEGWSTKIALMEDEDGAFGRECPQPDCLNYFKLFRDEYGQARERRRLTCPACGHTGDDQSFFTPDQLRRIRAGQDQFLRAAAHEVISEFSRSMGNRTVRLGPGVSIRYTAHHNPAPSPHPLPTYDEMPTLRTYECPNGGHRAVIYDLLTACPYCGPETPPRAVFDDNLAAMSRRLDDAQSMSAEAKAGGEQTTVLEQALTRVISALQNLAKQIHAQADKEPASGNPWQNVDRLRGQWVKDFGRDPISGLDSETIRTLRLAFGRRHIIEHNGSVADERYVKETQDGIAGRRVRLTTEFVRGSHAAAQTLANSLEETAAR